MVDKKTEENIAQFCGVTGASYVHLHILTDVALIMVTFSSTSILKRNTRTTCRVKDARKFLEKYKRVDVAVDAYYNDPTALANTGKAQQSQPSSSKLTALFEKYKGTVQLTASRWCPDLL